MNFIKYRKIYFVFSGVLILASLVCLIRFGLNFGIDFVGGSILRIEYKTQRPSNQAIKNALVDLDLGEVYIQPTGERGVIIRMKNVSEETRQKIVQRLENTGEFDKVQVHFESISPVIGRELKQKTKIVVISALLAIVLYIAFAFRRVSRPAKSWQYGIVSLLALFHDVFIPLGIFSVLGKYQDVQITIPVITALLTVLGYSINNTVVVFDRVRENLLTGKGVSFEQTVNESINQTLTRSINTSLTTLFVLCAIFFFGGETLKYFSLALILGIVFGTYSSLFLAGPILVSWLNLKRK